MEQTKDKTLEAVITLLGVSLKFNNSAQLILTHFKKLHETNELKLTENELEFINTWLEKFEISKQSLNSLDNTSLGEETPNNQSVTIH